MRMPHAVRVRIELNVTPDGRATVDVDGCPAPARPVSWLDGIHQPHLLVWLEHRRQYDVELWLEGELVGYVPGPAPEVEAAYDEAEEAERRCA